MSRRDEAAEQLGDWSESKHTSDTLTTSTGAPVDARDTSMTAGPRGPVLLQDLTLIDELAHFDRERIPERVVHGTIPFAVWIRCRALARPRQAVRGDERVTSALRPQPRAPARSATSR